MWTRPDRWAGRRAVTGGLPSSGGHGVLRATADAGGGARAAPPGGVGGRGVGGARLLPTPGGSGGGGGRSADYCLGWLTVAGWRPLRARHHRHGRDALGPPRGLSRAPASGRRSGCAETAEPDCPSRAACLSHCGLPGCDAVEVFASGRMHAAHAAVLPWAVARASVDTRELVHPVLVNRVGHGIAPACVWLVRHCTTLRAAGPDPRPVLAFTRRAGCYHLGREVSTGSPGPAPRGNSRSVRGAPTHPRRRAGLLLGSPPHSKA